MGATGPAAAAAPGAPGHGELALACARGRTRVVRARAHSPLHLRTPRNHGHAAWAYATSFGGGLVDGDQLSLEVEVGRGAAGFVSTQGPTRVYRSPGGCRSALRAKVGEGGVLVAVPDPLCLFAGARCEQRTELDLEPGASLVWVDVLGAGRVARGERWAFAGLDASLRVRVGVRGDEGGGGGNVNLTSGLALIDERVLLEPAHGDLRARLGRFDALATVVLAGPKVAAAARALLDAVAGEAPGRRAALVWSASALRDGEAVLLRVAAEEMQALLARLRAALSFVPELLGDDPFARRP